MAMVWNESETGALEKNVPIELKSIHDLREQVDRISLEKVSPRIMKAMTHAPIVLW